VALLAAASQRAGADEPVAPFRLRGLDGRVFDSSKQLPGRVTIITFWRLEQKHSLRILEDLAKIHEEFAMEGVGIVAVICEKPDPMQVEQVVSELKLQFPILFDPDRSLYAALGVKVYPSSWFIDPRGNRRFAYPGHRRDFPVVARANIELLLGRISEQERETRLEQREAPPTKGTVGGPVRSRLARTAERSAPHLGAGDVAPTEPRCAVDPIGCRRS
jgi:peroxiredoxin